MKFSHNMHDYCSFCFKQLYGSEECKCSQTTIEKFMDKEIIEEVEKIKMKYKTAFGIFLDKDAIENFKNNNKTNYPSRDF